MMHGMQGWLVCHSCVAGAHNQGMGQSQPEHMCPVRPPLADVIAILCRPADDSGAPAPVGKKVDGEFIRSMDADWRHTGLRSPITAKGAKLSPVTAGR